MENDYWKKYVFQIDRATNYNEGLAKLDSIDYKLALIDYKLNEEDFRNGFHFAQECINRGVENYLVYSGDSNLRKIPKEFAHRFLVKPTTDKEKSIFESRLKELI